MFDAAQVARSFPALQQAVHQRPLVYWDNGATTQKPESVLDAMLRYYQVDNANVHRGVHALSQRADKAYENVRRKVQQFIHASFSEEIIFTYGTTDGINLLAHSLGESLQPGDEILISTVEHHANIVPWQLLCERKQAVMKVVPVQDDGTLDMASFHLLLSARTKIVSVSHVSNVLGIINPIEAIITAAHALGARVIVDAAQSIAHLPIDVQALDVDFMVFSGHKMYGPTGVGILYGKKAWLEAMPPYRGGGAMIHEVSFEKTTYNTLPYKFEAGTPPIAAVIGLGAAIDFIQGMGWEAIVAHDRALADALWTGLSDVEGLDTLGAYQQRLPLVSFTLRDVHAHDVATLLDRQGIAVRAGHHCAMPLMQRFGVVATTRACGAVYNTPEDVTSLVKALNAVRDVFK